MKATDKVYWIAIVFTIIMMVIGCLSCGSSQTITDDGYPEYLGVNPDYNIYNRDFQSPEVYLIRPEELSTETISLLTLQSLEDYLEWRKDKNKWYSGVLPNIEDYYYFLKNEYDVPPVILTIDNGNRLSSGPCTCNATYRSTAIWCDDPPCNTCTCNKCGHSWPCN